MDLKIIKFDDTEIEEYKFHQNKNPFSINHIDINDIEIPINFPFIKQNNKNINSGLTYNENYLNAEKRLNTKESLRCFYMPENIY